MIDLHSHSTFSDGSESPEHVVELAASAGCSAVALTDHDGLGGLQRAAERARGLGIDFVPGCEVSCTFQPGTMHILCYFIEPIDGPLQTQLGVLRMDREQRNHELVDRLNALGIPITLEEVAAQAGSSTIGRPHFAAVLLNKGLVSSIGEAFDRFLGKGSPAYVSKARVSAELIIEETRASGGVAVLAHPQSLGVEMATLGITIAKLAASGLSGLECFYGRYDPPMRMTLAELAEANGLVATGGSDYHGTYKPDLQMGIGTGDLNVPDEAVSELSSRRP